MKNREIHGLRDTKLYDVWNAMRHRCHNANHKEYHRYGGRGITVCSSWANSFKKFYDWSILNGYNDNLSIDRINNNGNYEPSKCRWATNIIQNTNQRLRVDNKSGYKGIDYIQKKQKWRARIKLKGIEYSLGNHLDIKDAINARNSFILENNMPHTIQIFKEA